MVETPKTTNPSYNTSENVNLIFFENETDPTLEIEDWMFDENYFGATSVEYTQDCDNELKIEEWMLDENLFRGNEDGENLLELESWMISEKTWEI